MTPLRHHFKTNFKIQNSFSSTTNVQDKDKLFVIHIVNQSKYTMSWMKFYGVGTKSAATHAASQIPKAALHPAGKI